MDKLNYSELVQTILKSHFDNLTDDQDETEVQLILDVERHHYLIMVAGWHKQNREYGSLIRVDIEVSIDLWKAYKFLVEELMQNANLIADRFHVML
jgi:hypothetical protein